jgi:uncharacterized protein
MILDLRQFEEFPAQVVLAAGSGEIEAHDGRVVRIEGVRAELAIQKAATEYFCQGRVQAGLVLECSRCLKPFHVELSEPTDFIVCSEEQAAGREAFDDEDYVYFQGNDLKVDIVEPVRQALVLALPLKPLCVETCKGLCPRCGTDLNEKSCNCRMEVPDTRWDGLRNLFPNK